MKALFRFTDVKYKDIIDIPALQIEEGKITTLIGASGSGKTTILKMLNKLISPTNGEILYNGTSLKKIDSVMHRREVAMLSQGPAIFEGTIRDNLNSGLMFQEKEVLSDIKLKQILERVKLNKVLDNNANTLSGGEKQRLALGRVLVLNPNVYLLDEPSTALDVETEDVLIKMLIEYVQNDKKTIVMVTHSKEIAQKYSDVIIEISEGKSTGRFTYERSH